jgi:hypothetical protein
MTRDCLQELILAPSATPNNFIDVDAVPFKEIEHSITACTSNQSIGTPMADNHTRRLCVEIIHSHFGPLTAVSHIVVISHVPNESHKYTHRNWHLYF